MPAFNSLWTNHRDGTRKIEYKVDRLGRNLKLVDYHIYDDDNDDDRRR